jgi:hypothetical protein
VGREKQRSEPLVFYHCVEKDRREAVFLFVVRWSLMALNGQISFAGFCQLSGNSGQRGSLAPSGFVR